jgi:hypothetical protein
MNENRGAHMFWLGYGAANEATEHNALPSCYLQPAARTQKEIARPGRAIHFSLDFGDA